MRPAAKRTRPTVMAVLRACARWFASVKLELLLPCLGLHEITLLPLIENEVTQHKVIHLGTHEAGKGLIGRAHDRLAANIERRVHQDRAPGESAERAKQIVIERI